MRRLTYLAAAAAATGALAIIPLAAASTSSASPAPGSAAVTYENHNWAGTLVKAKGSGSLRVVAATFTVPKVTCSRSIGGGKTSTYSEVSYWVGLGGFNVPALEQAGIAATCASKTSAPHYGAWFEMVPRDKNMVPIHLTTNPDFPGFSGSKPGKAKPVKAGDIISVIVQDDGNTLAESGQYYSVQIVDTTQGTGYLSLGNLSPGIRGNDKTAEVVTERTSAGLSGPLVGLAYTGSAHYTEALVTTFANQGQYVGLSATPSFTSTRLLMTDAKGHLLIIPSALSSYGGRFGPGGHSFTTYWVAP